MDRQSSDNQLSNKDSETNSQKSGSSSPKKEILILHEIRFDQPETKSEGSSAGILDLPSTMPKKFNTDAKNEFCFDFPDTNIDDSFGNVYRVHSTHYVSAKIHDSNPEAQFYSSETFDSSDFFSYEEFEKLKQKNLDSLFENEKADLIDIKELLIPEQIKDKTLQIDLILKNVTDNDLAYFQKKGLLFSLEKKIRAGKFYFLCEAMTNYNDILTEDKIKQLKFYFSMLFILKHYNSNGFKTGGKLHYNPEDKLSLGFIYITNGNYEGASKFFNNFNGNNRVKTIFKLFEKEGFPVYMIYVPKYWELNYIKKFIKSNEQTLEKQVVDLNTEIKSLKEQISKLTNDLAKFKSENENKEN